MSNENVLFQVEDDELTGAVQEDEVADSRKYLIFAVDDLKSASTPSRWSSFSTAIPPRISP